MIALQRIMHVEDDPSIQAITKLALEAIGGFEVTGFSSGEEALTRFVQCAPQLLLLDVMMPGLNGPSTLKKLQQQYDLSQIPVVFMTAKVQPNEIESYIALGAADVVVKPFDPMLLASQIGAIWERFQSKRT